MPARPISYMKFLFMIAQLGAVVVRESALCKMQFAAVLFTTLTEHLKLCSSAKAGLFLNFEQK